MKQLLVGALFFGVMSQVLHADVLLKADQTQINEGQTFRLIISTDTATSSYPDLAPLRNDFNIVGTEQSTNYNIYNGQTSASIRWVVLVVPKHTGVITIPSLSVGQEKTNSLKLEILGHKSYAKNNHLLPSEDVLLTAEVDKKEHYINQQLLYTVKLYTNKQLLNVTYQEPHISHGLIISLGDAERYQANKNGTIYTVEEQRYAFFPQKSGDLTISPPVIDAVIYEGATQPIQIRAKPITVNIKPVPEANNNNPWLPASAATLMQSYDKPLENLQEGDTLVRTVTLKVTGFPAQLLPDLTFKKSDGLNVYSASPTVKSQLVNGQLVSEKSFKVTYLFDKRPTVTLPAVSLNWFNTEKNKLETLALPEQIVTLQMKAPNAQATATSENQDKINDNQAGSSSETIMADKITAHYRVAFYIAILLGCGWLITFFWMRRAINNKPQQEQKTTTETPLALGDTLKQLKNACLNNNPYDTQRALLQWAQQRFAGKKILNLNELAQVMDDPAIQRELTCLNRVLYQGKNNDWQGHLLWQLIANYQSTVKTKKRVNTSSLPEL